ncbi:MAG TPA: response regulator transcription factor [Acidimicrobiales bacterium]|nr:response regulator transcription factor [Acidimicrobiales bacterium]
MASVEASTRAHDAFRRRDWQAAYDAFRACEEMGADDQDALAESAHWLGLPDEVIASYTEAYRLHLEAGSAARAALSAFMLAIYLRLRGDGAQADGWLARSHRLLGSTTEGAEHGYPLYLESARLMGSDLDAAIVTARRMQDLGRRFDDDTLVALGVFFEGRALVKQARVREGRALLDEAMLAALSDKLKPMWTGAIYCGLLDACHELVDLRRAREWTEATSRWCSPLPVASLYPGICRVHTAEILQVHGAWEQAEAEALGVCQDMTGIDVFVVADGWYEVGEIRRRRGDLAGAEEAYAQAHEVGRDPQPGLALLRLAQGRSGAATSSIAATLAGFAGSRLERAPLLAAQVEIALAAGDVELASVAAAEVIDTAETFDSDGLRAAGHRCQGAVGVTVGQGVTALASLRLAFNLWHELDAPYEAARTRVLLAEAYRALDDEDAAARECAAARACFERLGAAADVRALLQEKAVPCGLSPREVEVLRRVATGESNRDIAKGLFISEKTVARHVSNIFTKLDVSSRSAATAFAYENRLLAGSPE